MGKSKLQVYLKKVKMLRKANKKDVRKWSEHFLEIPNKHLGGFPACPFAKKTWKDNKVLVEVKEKINGIKQN